MTEAERKRRAALEAAGGGPLVVTDPATVRWLLCGRGRPVDVGAADFRIVTRSDAAHVLYADIEPRRSRRRPSSTGRRAHAIWSCV